jgi:hypothetical protein
MGTLELTQALSFVQELSRKSLLNLNQIYTISLFIGT